MSHILGISAFYHDSAACLVSNGVVVAAAQEERFTRKKHDHAFPSNAVSYCLEEAGITIDDITGVAFYDKPWIKFERLLETYLAFAPQGISSFLKAMPLWLKEKLWMGDLITRELSYDGNLIYPEHHQSHAASAFFPSPFESAAILTIDGVGEWTTCSYGVGRGNTIQLDYELKFPHSLGLLYSAMTYYTGFKVNSGEYKVMGLAPYGEPKYVDLILDNLIDLKEDGSFRLDMKYFNYCQGLTMTSSAFDELFGAPPRAPESELTQREMDLARSIQEVTEIAVLRMARHVRKTTGEKNLCLAGGVALNCVANGKIIKENIFDTVWIQPAAGDAGGALGAALFAWHQVEGNPRKSIAHGDSSKQEAGYLGDLQKGTYLGPEYSSADIKEYLTQENITFHECSDSEAISKTAEALSEEKVIGWFNGRMEFGPRSLGGRSILGDPRCSKMQSVMNLKIKYRESFRPFAPSCLSEDVSDYFQLDADSPYMLVVAPIQEKIRKPVDDTGLFGIEKLNLVRSELPAITHLDYSARVQSVHKETNPRYHALLEEFKKRTGCSVLINTSFNVRGEPIVNTPKDAYLCFMRTEMDVLVLENCILYKEEQTPLEDDSDWQNEFELD